MQATVLFWRNVQQVGWLPGLADYSMMHDGGIRPWATNLLSFVAKHPHCFWQAVPWSLDICSTRRSTVHRLGMQGISNRDTHLYPPRNNSSVHLRATTEARRCGRITDGMWSGWTTLTRRFSITRQSNGCSTLVPCSRAAYQWIERTAHRMKKTVIQLQNRAQCCLLNGDHHNYGALKDCRISITQWEDTRGRRIARCVICLENVLIGIRRATRIVTIPKHVHKSSHQGSLIRTLCPSQNISHSKSR